VVDVSTCCVDRAMAAAAAGPAACASDDRAPRRALPGTPATALAKALAVLGQLFAMHRRLLACGWLWLALAGGCWPRRE
jgi:hypothetical protein